MIRLNKKSLAFIFLGIVIFSALMLFVIADVRWSLPSTTIGGRNDNGKTAVIEIGGVDYNFEIVDTDRKRIRGLSDRDSMGEFTGMYFVFDHVGINRMVMRDMRFPLDMVWLNGSIVTDIVENFPPEPLRSEAELTVYSNKIPGDGVLELPAGFVARTGLKVGDGVQIIRN